MRFRNVAIFAAGAAGLVPVQAKACEYDSFLFQLPGETKAQAQERSDQIMTDYAVKRHLDRESYDFEKSTVIYLARVSSRTNGHIDSGRRILPSTSVHPLNALKGALPLGARTLTDEAQSGMCTDYGDGQGARGQVGALIVVFEGLPKTPERPRGIDSFPAISIRTIELLDKLRGLGKDLDD